MRPHEIEGLIPLTTGCLLHYLASLVPEGQCIVEIGAFKGKSTRFLSSGARPGVDVISIDPHGLEGSERGRNDRFALNSTYEHYLRSIRGLKNVVPVRELSQKAPLPELPIGLLWIDGDHSQEAVFSDVSRFSPKVVSGGFIVIDDFGTYHPGVDRVVAQMIKSDPRWKNWSREPRPLAWAERK